ncbi:hypothetical protein DL95DRAFT_85541 [Leptodontidium sp. 2 PMI_412]|nr:hypothetical protein DL95DRAFT_85541 [Leptodontidium sp. 2 PMI_412]
MLVASSWKDMDAVRINAMYKILVSVFAWASKSDLILDVEQSIKEQDDSNLFKSVQDTRKMLRVEDCRPQGIKGSKDFLLSLGSHLLDDNKYKGFFIQRFGVHSLTIRPVAKEAIIGMSRTGHSDYVAHLPNLDSWAPSAETSRISDGWKSNAKIPSKELTWENTTLPRKRIRPVSEEYGNRSDDDRSRHGSRNGKLSPEVAEKAKRMRKLGACWRCRILKVPCSAGETCDRCNKVSQGSPDAHFLCSRASFRDYSEIFFPDFLHDHLEKPRYDATIHNLESDLIDTLCTTVTFDGKRSMLFQVNIFAPNEQYPRELIRRTVDGSVQTTTSHPVGLLGISSSEVKQTVQDYLKDVLANNPLFIHSGQETTTAVNSVLSRLFNFSSCQERNIDILQQAFLVLVIYSVTGKTLFFMEPGLFANQSRLAENAHNQFGSAASSWLMDIALNNAMRTLALQTVKVLLSDLERAMRSRTRDRWAYCFAVILVLCSCVEEMQIWALSLLDIEQKINGLGDLSRRKWVLHACTSLEEQPVRIIVDIFHSIYRSTADSSYGTASNLGFNPLKQIIRNGCRIPKGTDFGLEGHTVNLVRDLGQIVLHSYGELRGLAGPPNFEGTLEKIIKRNRGRLVSQFLLSFVDDTTIEEGLVAIDTSSTWMKPLSE